MLNIILTDKNLEWEATHEEQEEDMKRNEIYDEHIAAPCWHLE